MEQKNIKDPKNISIASDDDNFNESSQESNINYDSFFISNKKQKIENASQSNFRGKEKTDIIKKLKELENSKGLQVLYLTSLCGKNGEINPQEIFFEILQMDLEDAKQALSKSLSIEFKRDFKAELKDSILKNNRLEENLEGIDQMVKYMKNTKKAYELLADFVEDYILKNTPSSLEASQ